MNDRILHLPYKSSFRFADNITFYEMVLTGQNVTVVSKKEYFRLGELKCYVEMLSETKEVIAKGTISGIIKELSK
jgi:3-hydroxyacyl-[acyl-carrier-protein] dehydratase